MTQSVSNLKRVTDLSNTEAARFDSIRFLYLLTLLKKAQSQRSSVAVVLENKAGTILEKYLDDYNASLEAATSVVSSSKDSSAHSSVLAELSREVSVGRESSPSTKSSLLDEQWQQQEQMIIQSVADNKLANAASPIFVVAKASLITLVQCSNYESHYIKGIRQKEFNKRSLKDLKLRAL